MVLPERRVPQPEVYSIGVRISIIVIRLGLAEGLGLVSPQSQVDGCAGSEVVPKIDRDLVARRYPACAATVNRLPVGRDYP